MNEQQTEINIPIGEKPWLDPSGKMLTEDQLRIVSKDWTPAIWEDFLVQTVEKPLREVNKHPWAYINAVEQMTCTFWNEGGFGHSDEKLEALVRRKMRDHLTAQQRQILKHYYWDDMSEREIAQKMSLSHAQVHTSKKNSLNKLKEILASDVSSHRIGAKSKKVFPPLEHPEMDLDICAVYLEDLSGPMWCRGG